MLDLQFSAKEILRESGVLNDLSFKAQDDRLRQTAAALSELSKDLNYGVRAIENLKEKHISALVQHWKNKQITDATIRNRLSHLRVLAGVTNRPGIVKTNTEYGVMGKREFVDRAFSPTDKQIQSIERPTERAAVVLAAAFGLRKEESLKTSPYDIKDNRLILSGTKGSRPRQLEIKTEEQKDAIAYAQGVTKVTGSNNQVPNGTSFKAAAKAYEKSFEKSFPGERTHGLRYAAAQAEYLASKAAGATHDEARQVVSNYLGHERLSVVDVYCSAVY